MHAFGLLSQIVENQWSLEDLYDFISLRFAEDIELGSSTIFTEGCFVIVKGLLQEENKSTYFLVNHISMPPVEPRAKDFEAKYYPSIFASIPQMQHTVDALKQIERRVSPQTSILIVSDVFLDVSKVLFKLETLLDKCRPQAVILCGRFFQETHELYTAKAFFSYKSTHCVQITDNIMFLISVGKFTVLAKMLSRRDHLKNTPIFLCPSEQDVLGSFPGILPRPHLPRELEEVFSGLRVIFVSNPCRITVLSQEIVVFRDEISTKLMRNAVLTPQDETADLPGKVKNIKVIFLCRSAERWLLRPL